MSLSKKERTLTRTIAGKANGMENEFLAVVIQANGTLGVTDKYLQVSFPTRVDSATTIASTRSTW